MKDGHEYRIGRTSPFGTRGMMRASDIKQHSRPTILPTAGFTICSLTPLVTILGNQFIAAVLFCACENVSLFK